ncbi:transposase [Streptomyces sp. NPDC059002]|uniref:transposase n=1 Tax=Streptomyces sp. NPDC059002 TaxID=3346690 RepID=UPI00368323D8
MRNIATACFGGDATDQSLHHFIGSSHWDWRPVRAALARSVERTAPPEAWVVRSMVIPKAGEHSVGVERRPVRPRAAPDRQRAAGVRGVGGVPGAEHARPSTGGSSCPTPGSRTGPGGAVRRFPTSSSRRARRSARRPPFSKPSATGPADAARCSATRAWSARGC